MCKVGAQGTINNDTANIRDVTIVSTACPIHSLLACLVFPQVPGLDWSAGDGTAGDGEGTGGDFGRGLGDMAGLDIAGDLSRSVTKGDYDHC